MARYHVSEDGVPRICSAATPESCTAKGVDGASAPHGDFTDAAEARRFAEQVLEDSSVGSGLAGMSKRTGIPEATPGVPRQLDTPAALMVDSAPDVEGWTKITDDQSNGDGPYLQGPRGEIIQPRQSGEAGWDLTDDEGVYLGNHGELIEAVNELDRYSGDSYSEQFRAAEARAGGAAAPVAPAASAEPAQPKISEKRQWLLDDIQSAVVPYSFENRREEWEAMRERAVAEIRSGSLQQAENEARQMDLPMEFTAELSRTKMQEASSKIADRKLFSTDPVDGSEYRVEGGRLKNNFEGEDYDLGPVEQIPNEEAERWNRQTFLGGGHEFQDDEIFVDEDSDGSTVTYFSSQGNWYRAREAQ